MNSARDIRISMLLAEGIKVRNLHPRIYENAKLYYDLKISEEKVIISFTTDANELKARRKQASFKISKVYPINNRVEEESQLIGTSLTIKEFSNFYSTAPQLAFSLTGTIILQ